MSFKTTNLLLATLVLVGAYFLLIERETTPTYELEQEQAQEVDQQEAPLFTAAQLPTESVVSISIMRGDDEKLVLSKEGQDWFQTQPVRFALQTWSARQLVDDAAGLRRTQRFMSASSEGSDQPTLAQAGLAPSRAVVILRIEGESVADQTIHLGKKVVGGRAYAMINDDPYVYVVNDTLHQQVLDSKIVDWRKKSIGVPSESQANGVLLKRGGRSIGMDKIDGEWLFALPLSGRVDKQSVAGLLSAARGVAINRFVTDRSADLSIYGLHTPTVVLEIYQPIVGDSDPDGSGSGDKVEEEGDGNQTQVLMIGAPVDLQAESYFASWGPPGGPGRVGEVVFTISREDVGKFKKTTNDLRDARITPIESSDVHALTIEKPSSNTVKLLRSPSGWSFAQPGPSFEADSTEASLLVEAVTGAKARSYEPHLVDLGEPIATITATAIGRLEPDVLRVYTQGQTDTYPVVRNDEAIHYLVPVDALERVFEPIASLRQRTVLDLSRDEITRVTIKRADGLEHVFARGVNNPGSAPAGPTIQPTTTQPAPRTQPAPTTPPLASMTQPAAESASTQRAAAVATQPMPETTRVESPKRSDQVAQGPWRLFGHERFESMAFEKLLDQLTPLRVQRWLTEASQADTPNESRAVTVYIETVDGRHYQVVVDPETRNALLADQPESKRFEVSQALVELLLRGYRDQTVLPINMGDIQSVQVIYHDQSVTISRDSSGRYVGGEGPVVDQSVAGNLFDALSGLQVARFLEPVHLQQPPLKVVVKMQGGTTHRLAVSEPEKAGGSAAATNGDQWFTLDGGVIAAFKAVVVGQPAGLGVSRE